MNPILTTEKNTAKRDFSRSLDRREQTIKYTYKIKQVELCVDHRSEGVST